MKSNKKFSAQIENAISNISKDRSVTTKLLEDLMMYMGLSPDKHAEVGTVAAKYLETLQRSNEQLVKIASLLQKKEQKESATLSDDDREELFRIIKEG
jgi:hypothetical protein